MATRRRLEPSQSRALILDATERIMMSDGYAAVSTRRVAAVAGLKAPLVHYYYPTIDDLLLACYQRTAQAAWRRIEEALASDRPLHAIWALDSDPDRTVLAAEFLALANHRKAIRAEIARNVERFRAAQEAALARTVGKVTIGGRPLGGDVAALLLSAVGRAIAIEAPIGIVGGHDAVRAFMATLIADIEPNAAA